MNVMLKYLSSSYQSSRSASQPLSDTQHALEYCIHYFYVTTAVVLLVFKSAFSVRVHTWEISRCIRGEVDNCVRARYVVSLCNSPCVKIERLIIS